MAYINRNKIPVILRKGDKGDNAFIRYSANADGTDFTETWSEGQQYIGFATGQSAPTDKSEYTWVRIVPQKSIDYWTEEDKAEMKAFVDEAILNGEW